MSKQREAVDKAVKSLTAVSEKRQALRKEDLLKTGSTLLDIAISGHRGGGFTKGRYFWMVGDSSSGKTFLMLTCLAEAAINPQFNKHRFIYDNVEDGALMDFKKYFGPRMAARVEPPAVDKEGEPVYSSTIEEFYFNLDDALNGAAPCIYLLDSMDALGSAYSDKKFQEAKKSARKETDVAAKGDYGDGKAKINSTAIRRVVNKLQATGSILIILSQTRDDIGAGMFDEQKTHAGGHALKFYSTVQLWSSVGSQIKRSVNGIELAIGVNCRVKIKKNRLTGKERSVEIPIHYETGIDDIGSMIDFMVKWGFWHKAKNGVVDATSAFEAPPGRREEIIKWIEENDAREDLEELVEASWVDIENRLRVDRKSKYQ